MSSRISGQKINYSVRPGKAIERKMIKEILSRLFIFDDLSKYQYIGFGSKYFTDFILFHKSLNLKKMISLEKDSDDSERYNFNKPFQCIEIFFESSSDWIDTKSEINEPTIVWFDYDQIFSKFMVDDCRQLARILPSGSLFAISFNYTVPKLDYLNKVIEDLTIDNYQKWFEYLFGNTLVNPNMDTRGLDDKFKYLQRIIPILITSLEKVITERNLLIPEPDSHLKLQPTFSFTYRDGAPMATFGWMILDSKDQLNFNLMRLNEFEFYQPDMVNPYDIDPASLTMREISYLREIVSTSFDPDDTSVTKYFKAEEIESFRKLYKYFPAFTEIEAY